MKIRTLEKPEVIVDEKAYVDDGRPCFVVCQPNIRAKCWFYPLLRDQRHMGEMWGNVLLFQPSLSIGDNVLDVRTGLMFLCFFCQINRLLISILTRLLQILRSPRKIVDKPKRTLIFTRLGQN